jgi:sn-glycerol 3-phosphate transport system ATP-binding protein
LLEGSFSADGEHFIFDGMPIAIDPKIGKANAGHPATLGIRPEHARMVPIGTPGSIPATVDFVEELGAGRVIHSDINGSNFALAISDHTSGQTGEPIALQLPGQHIHLFSHETGIRLDLGLETARVKELAS